MHSLVLKEEISLQKKDMMSKRFENTAYYSLMALSKQSKDKVKQKLSIKLPKESRF